MMLLRARDCLLSPVLSPSLDIALLELLTNFQLPHGLRVDIHPRFKKFAKNLRYFRHFPNLGYMTFRGLSNHMQSLGYDTSIWHI